MSDGTAGRTAADERPIWRKVAPYAVAATVVAGAMWWFQAESSFATLKDGGYSCQAVFVNENGQYEVLVDDAGNPFLGRAEVRGGAPVSLSGVDPDQLASLSLEQRGTSHFHVTDDWAPHSYNAMACQHEEP
jgi:hypothetical protein